MHQSVLLLHNAHSASQDIICIKDNASSSVLMVITEITQLGNADYAFLAVQVALDL